MRYRVQVVQRSGRVLHEGEYDFAVEGDIERAVTDAMAQARKVASGPLWDAQIDIRPVQHPLIATP